MILAKVKDYFTLQKEIYEYFGYKEDWVLIPMEDHTDEHWMVTGKGSHGDKYVHSPVPFTKDTIEAGNEIYGGWIYTQRFLGKWVYRGDDYTLVCCDTKTDGNKILMIFDNTKECTDKKLQQAYLSNWGSMI
jgi:hypothetical protein